MKEETLQLTPGKFKESLDYREQIRQPNKNGQILRNIPHTKTE